MASERRQGVLRASAPADSGAEAEAEVISLDRAEYDQAVKATLKAAGVTYRQLQKQAKTGRFSSPDARKLWLAIGTTGCA
jgi:hypothetical protein